MEGEEAERWKCPAIPALAEFCILYPDWKLPAETEEAEETEDEEPSLSMVLALQPISP